MHKRLNITLPEETVRVLDRVAGKRGRSDFINRAVTHYLGATARRRLARELKEGYRQRAQRDLAVAEAWVPIEDEAWGRRGRG